MLVTNLSKISAWLFNAAIDSSFRSELMVRFVIGIGIHTDDVMSVFLNQFMCFSSTSASEV